MKIERENTRIKRFDDLIVPQEIKKKYLLSPETGDMVANFRNDIENIISGKDPRLLVIAGPCSIHDPKAACEYADRLMLLRKKFLDKIYIVMRVYFEKPRTTVGWKGLINDPDLDGSNNIEKGMCFARELLLQILGRELPTATEFLDPIIPQYIGDLVCWAAIGARTTESQTHREMASGLSMPVGFKNNTNGDIGVAVNAMLSATAKHSFLGINDDGQIRVVQTLGNMYNHLILRGGGGASNYDIKTVNHAIKLLKEKNTSENIMIDCSHANSNKDYSRQKDVWLHILKERAKGNSSLMGLMLESNIHEGNQAIQSNLQNLEYGVSVTDACINFSETEELMSQAYSIL